LETVDGEAHAKSGFHGLAQNSAPKEVAQAHDGGQITHKGVRVIGLGVLDDPRGPHEVRARIEASQGTSLRARKNVEAIELVRL